MSDGDQAHQLPEKPAEPILELKLAQLSQGASLDTSDEKEDLDTVDREAKERDPDDDSDKGNTSIEETQSDNPSPRQVGEDRKVDALSGEGSGNLPSEDTAFPLECGSGRSSSESGNESGSAMSPRRSKSPSPQASMSRVKGSYASEEPQVEHKQTTNVRGQEETSVRLLLEFDTTWSNDRTADVLANALRLLAKKGHAETSDGDRAIASRDETDVQGPSETAINYVTKEQKPPKHDEKRRLSNVGEEPEDNGEAEKDECSYGCGEDDCYCIENAEEINNKEEEIRRYRASEKDVLMFIGVVGLFVFVIAHLVAFGG